MVEQRYAHLELPSHTRAIDLGQDVTGKVGLEVGILNLRETIVCLGSLHKTAQKVDRLVSLKLAPVPLGEESVAHVLGDRTDGVEISLSRVTSQVLQRCLGAKEARRPVHLGIDRAEKSKSGCTHRSRKERAHLMLLMMPIVPAVSAKDLVAAIARKGDGHLLTGKGADEISRQR